MDQLSFNTLIAVLEEMFGQAVFWAMAAVAVLVLIAFVYVLIRRPVSSRAVLLCEIIGVVAGVGGVYFVFAVTGSAVVDVGGPIDVIMVALIWLVSAIGAGMLAFTLLGLFAPRR